MAEVAATTDRSVSRFERSVLHHLSGVKGLRGVQAFTGATGEWSEGARFGEILEGVHRKVLSDFDAEAGGAVEALSGPNAGWMATYMLGGPGLDLVLIMHLRPLEPKELQERLRVIEAAIGWVMLAALEDRRSEQDDRAFIGEIGVQILLEAAQARSLRVLADQWIARLEKVLQPGLVAVCWVSAEKPKLGNISGGGLIERQSEARGSLEGLASSAIARREPKFVLGSKYEDGCADETDDLALLRQIGGESALLVPVLRREEVAAVVIVLFDADTENSRLLRSAAAHDLGGLLSEALAIQARGHPSLVRRSVNWVTGIARGILGPWYWKLKLALLVSVIALVVASITPSQKRPSFTAVIEAQERQIVSAPYDGFLAEAPFRLGDEVQGGEIIVAFEEADLRLELAQTQAEQAETAAELQTAQAQRDAARARLLMSRIAQGDVQIDLLERRLDLARTRAERSAVIVGGDAWRRVGDRVRLGEPLLELAASDSFRVRAFVDEDWIAELPQQAAATLLLSAYPNIPMEVKVEGIGRDPSIQDGQNTFPVWLTFQSPPEVRVLDGMRGVVRIYVGQRTVLQAYSRSLQRWALRTAWRWQS